MVFPNVDYSTWKSRLEKELKNQTWTGIQWEVEEGITLEPYYESGNVPDLSYLHTFHQQWEDRFGSIKPKIFALLHGLNDEEKTVAETYGQTAWVSTNQPEKTGKLPVHCQATQYDPLVHFVHGLELPEYQNQPIHIHAADVQQSGGTNIQALASLLLGLSYLEKYHGSALFSQEITLHLASGVHFWKDLCTLRAARLLVMNMENAWGRNIRFVIQAESAVRNWTPKDSDMNLLRNAVGMVAAILGGADAIMAFPNKVGDKYNLEACRHAVNLGHLALEEAQLYEFADPAGGSFEADVLTHHLAQHAWQLFQQWHAQGFENIAEERVVQKAILAAGVSLQKQFAAGKIPLVGVNLFPSEMAQKSDPLPPLWSDRSSLKPFFLDDGHAEST